MMIIVLFLSCSLNLEEPDNDPIEIPVVKKPWFNPPQGTYGAEVEVAVSCPTDGVVIYYTIDGTEPSFDNHEGAGYGQVFLKVQDKTVKAIAVKRYGVSEVVTAVYD